MRPSPLSGAGRGGQHRNAAPRHLLAVLFEHRASNLCCVRNGDAGAVGVHLNLPDPNVQSALEYDARDPLAAFALEFHHPRDAVGRKLVYLCGHSLGLQTISTREYVAQELSDWERLAVLGHHAAERPWVSYHERAAAGLAALAGADESEVIAMNSLTVNLHLMMVSFFRPQGERNCVLIERSAFPSDRYAIVSQLEFHGLPPEQHLIEVAPRAGEDNLRTEDLIACIE